MAPKTYNPFAYLPRRLQVVVGLAIFLITTILLFGSHSDRATKYREELSQGARKAADLVPGELSRQIADSKLNPFRVPAHEPPAEQQNSTSGDVSWFSDLKWRNPFSSAVAVDDRAVLPIQAVRPPIYTYYDVDAAKGKQERQVESELLHSWRRAWWAKGFRPIVLGRAEAQNNPLYKKLKGLKLDVKLENDLLRWLAWGDMGTGLLSNWLTYPMCSYNDPILVALRHGQISKLSRFDKLDNALFVGEKKDINAAIAAILDADGSPKEDNVLDSVPKATFKVEKTTALAFYSVETLKSRYKKVYDELVSDSIAGKRSLRKLIESHLQSTWQGVFSDGIAVLRPIPQSITAATSPAFDLAGNLTICLDTPLPSACPPNIPKCNTCMSSLPIQVNTPRIYRNDSKLFTIGVVPHPYTMSSLITKAPISTVRTIRRDTKRDEYILAVTSEALGTGRASYDRIVYMKDVIASETGRAHSIWMTAERTFDKSWRDDISWTLGWPIPSVAIPDGKSDGPVPGEAARKKAKALHDADDFVPNDMPDAKGVKREFALLEQAKDVIKKKNTKANRKIKDAVEAWNLADTELWIFVRAFAARRRMERVTWDRDERSYVGSDARGGWSQWLTGDDGGEE